MVHVIEADLANPIHAQAVVELTGRYAEDPMGNGAPLGEDVLARLVPGLRAHPTTMVLLAVDDARFVGIATCFLGFSSFQARPLLNIHDLAVLPEFRKHGVGRALLDAVIRRAEDRGCCKVTLEVLENNLPAKALYAKAGFSQAVCVESAGGALFYARPI